MQKLQKDLKANEHTLLALVGHSPQVVTESIYALFKHRKIKVTNLKVVTTSTNKENVYNSLCAPKMNGKSVLENLSNDYQLPKINFTKDDILVPVDSDGNEVQDVKTDKEMKAVAQFLLTKVKNCTSDENHCLHASLAGGRKTMTFYLSYAMSIFGRYQDSLSHVFVSYPYESSEFYYPTPYSQMITTSVGSRDTKEATVELSRIPYVQLRPSLPTNFLENDISFEESERLFDLINRPISLEIDIQKQMVICSGVPIKLTPANFAFYLIMVDDLMDAREGFDCPSESDEVLAILYIEKRLQIKGINNKFVNLTTAIDFVENKHIIFKDSEVEGLKSGLKASFFNARKNEISKVLRAELPENIAEHYDIDSLSKTNQSDAKRSFSYFGLNIEQQAVTTY